MKTKTPPPTIAPPRPSRRTKASSPAQMSLMEFEPEETPVRVSAPRAAATARPKKVEVAAAQPQEKVTRVPKPPVPKTIKNVPVKAVKKQAPAETVRVVPETLLTSGAVWKMSGKNGVAYVQNAALAGELLATDPKNLAKAAMAVYYDKKGRAFAWQVRFDTDRWDEVMKRLA